MTARAADAGPWRIAVVSATVLVLELAFIRQIPAEVRAISYFTNLILMASFFGLGLGCILQDRRRLDGLLPLGVGLVFLFVLAFRGVVVYDEAKAVHFWTEYGRIEGEAPRIPLFPAAAAAFVLSALPFAALGQTLARTMNRFPRLVAYGWDIAGSLGGTALFAVCSYLGVPPWIWPPILLTLWAALFVRSKAGRAAHVAAGLLFLLFAHSAYEWRWSPYYFIQHRAEKKGLRVWVNSSFHQFALDFASKDPELAGVQRSMLAKFSRPYEVYREEHEGRSPERVLILGAGTGNDVNVALANGARSVTAVEIDPAILALGKERNASRPYADPRVRVRVDDARHHLKSSRERYDLIVFGTLDSQTLLAGQANLRLDNYVYTAESLEDAEALLAPGGMVAMYYSVFKDWLYARIYATVRAAFGDRVRMERTQDHILFNTIVLAARDLPDFRDSPENAAAYSSGIASRDDWPYIYLERPTIAPVYRELFVAVAALIAGAFALLRRIHPTRGSYANYLLLGLGFTLMESSAVVRLALLFGSTWVVNAVVFSSALLTIFLANLAVLKGAAPPLRLAWPALLGFILVNYAVPPAALAGLAPGARAAACALLIGAPIFFAATCFSRLFAEEPTTGYPLGINLVGAMAGGWIEYGSMVIGMRAVWLIVLAVYALAWLSTAAIRGGRPAAPHAPQ